MNKCHVIASELAHHEVIGKPVRSLPGREIGLISVSTTEVTQCAVLNRRNCFFIPYAERVGDIWRLPLRTGAYGANSKLLVRVLRAVELVLD